MKSALYLVLSFAIITYCLAAPVDLPEQDPETMGGYLEGDIIPDSLSRSVMKSPSKRWPNNTVCYRLDPKFSAAQKTDIENAMLTISSQSFVRFVKDTKNNVACASINLTPAGSGCNSNVGYSGGPHNVNLANNTSGVRCFSQGILMHELLHTCGFYHQHNAPERDSFIKIKYENIAAKDHPVFTKNTVAEATSFGIPYDCGSIMHYGPTAFSMNGQVTIEEIPPCTGIGQRVQLSASDIAQLNIMYPPKKI